jgi:uncharacterized protein DUF4242
VFLAELYLPSSDAKARRAAIGRAERAAAKLARAGAPVRYVRSVVVPGDEMCFLLFEADSAETVALVGETGGLAFDRVVEATG